MKEGVKGAGTGDVVADEEALGPGVDDLLPVEGVPILYD